MLDVNQAEEEDDEISASFYGKLSSVISWIRKDGSNGETIKKDKFANIILNIAD